jgi:NAD(P)-dependent dehydrogenase (short-subunit alcohol dehydrogenase family)
MLDCNNHNVREFSAMNILPLQGRKALVTGSTTGIGQAIAMAMRDAGAEVVFHGARKRSTHLPDGASCLTLDLTAPDSPNVLVEEAFKIHPGIDLLVSNAGSFFDVPFFQMTQKHWQRTIDINLRSSFFVTQSFARRLVAEKRPGTVVIVASTNAFQSEFNSSAYDISKGGLVTLTRSLALDLSKFGIRINAIAPGLVRTPLTEKWMNKNKALRQHYEKNIPLGRIGSAEDCAGAAVFLASQAASYITGQTLIIDGGLTIRQIGPL